MKLKDKISEKFTAGEMPNTFTIRMGELIRKAREEAGFSQRELAELIYRRQAALSDMENGKMEPNASTLVYLALNLNKPISYFFPKPYNPESNLKELTETEKEILIYTKQLEKSDQVRILAQIKALSDLKN
ncbi:MAG: helix-turn-helix transcriptional regulator [Thermotogota bacterium]|nr:helix-turn-helix transcriptional regulator [Thermotogota bacterium]